MAYIIFNMHSDDNYDDSMMIFSISACKEDNKSQFTNVQTCVNCYANWNVLCIGNSQI